MRARPLAGLWVAAAILGASSHAHHSFGMFDQTDGEEIVITGAVKRWQFVNPHTWLIITVTNDDGSLTDWSFEGSAVPVLLQRGIRGDTFVEGQTVTVVAAPMKDGRPGGGMKFVVLQDGSIVMPNDDGIPNASALERWPFGQ